VINTDGFDTLMTQLKEKQKQLAESLLHPQ
jgi:hypothetical protein